MLRSEVRITGQALLGDDGTVDWGLGGPEYGERSQVLESDYPSVTIKLQRTGQMQRGPARTCPHRKTTVLIAGGGTDLRDQFRRFLTTRPEIVELFSAADALRVLQTESPDLILLRPDRGTTLRALDAVREIRRVDRGVPIVFMTPESSEEVAIAAIKAGVTDYLKDPYEPDELAASVVRCLSTVVTSAFAPESGTVDLIGGCRMVGRGPPMCVIRSEVQRVAASDCNVLITGETGTGKQLVAELIHQNSSRRSEAFVSINCAAIPDSLIESELFGHEKGAFTNADIPREGILKHADKGTVLLDEIGDMGPCAQGKILHVIDTKRIRRVGSDDDTHLDVRVVAATNQDLNRLVLEGKFRKDLYYRLAVVCIHLPPLRQRREDLPLLLQRCIDELNQRFGTNVEGFTSELADLLLRYSWPGNVRELRNLAQAIFVSMMPEKPLRRIGLRDLPQGFRARIEQIEASPADEKDRLLAALLSTGWNKTKAAETLHWSRMTLYRKLIRYHLEETA